MRLLKHLINFFAAAIFSVGLLAAELPRELGNPGFELADPSSNTKLLHWRAVGDGPIIDIDDAIKFAGKQSVRILRKDGKSFGGIGQSIDALPWRGKIVQLTAMLRFESKGSGSVGLWLRADGSRIDPGAFTSTYNLPPPGDGAWTTRTAILVVPDDANALVFGAANISNGAMWADEFSIAELPIDGGTLALPAVQQYLQEAIGKIRGVALNAPKVDWPKQERVAKFLAKDATSFAQTYGAIDYLLKSLRDNHSHLIPPFAAKQLAENKRTDDFGLRSERIGPLGYVALSGYSGSAPSRVAAYIDELRGRIYRLNEPAVCGWIVDLRANGGGNMWPMVTGLAPLLGEGENGAFISPKEKTVWGINPGGEPFVGSTKSPGTTQTKFIENGNAYVAVLTGPRTASSGEAIAVAFRGKQHVRSFGEPTRGLSTANTTVSLSDGALMAITTSVYADRTGATYGSKIVPDEIVATTADVASPAEDPVVIAASKWLNSVTACGK